MVLGLLLNSDSATIQKLRDDEKVLVDFSVKLADQINSDNKYFVMENSGRSMAWKMVESLRRLVLRHDIFFIEIDQCYYGLRHIDSGELLKKTTYMITNCEYLLEEAKW